GGSGSRTSDGDGIGSGTGSGSGSGTGSDSGSGSVTGVGGAVGDSGGCSISLRVISAPPLEVSRGVLTRQRGPTTRPILFHSTRRREPPSTMRSGPHKDDPR